MPTAPAYTEEFRRQAVDLISSENLTIADAARRLGVDATTLRKWVRKYQPTPAPPPRRPSSRNCGGSARRTASSRWSETS